MQIPFIIAPSVAPPKEGAKQGLPIDGEGQLRPEAGLEVFSIDGPDIAVAALGLEITQDIVKLPKISEGLASNWQLKADSLTIDSPQHSTDVPMPELGEELLLNPLQGEALQAKSVVLPLVVEAVTGASVHVAKQMGTYLETAVKPREMSVPASQNPIERLTPHPALPQPDMRLPENKETSQSSLKGDVSLSPEHEQMPQMRRSDTDNIKLVNGPAKPAEFTSSQPAARLAPAPPKSATQPESEHLIRSETSVEARPKDGAAFVSQSLVQNVRNEPQFANADGSRLEPISDTPQKDTPKNIAGKTAEIEVMQPAAKPQLTQAPSPPAIIEAVEMPDDPDIISERLTGFEPSQSHDVKRMEAGTPSPLQLRPEAQRVVISQLAQVTLKPDQPVELRLDPQELGQVRMMLSSHEQSLTLVMSAERPETLDLMRRHIDQLAQEFQEMGYTDLNFTFTEQESAPDQHGGSPTLQSATTEHAEPEPQPQIIRLGTMAGLDIRI